MSGDSRTLPNSYLRWYIAYCARILYDESGYDVTSLDGFFTWVNSSRLIVAQFKSATLEGVENHRIAPNGELFWRVGLYYHNFHQQGFAKSYSRENLTCLQNTLCD